MNCLSSPSPYANIYQEKKGTKGARPAPTHGPEVPSYRAQASKSPSCPCPSGPKPQRPTQSYQLGKELPSLWLLSAVDEWTGAGQVWEGGQRGVGTQASLYPYVGVWLSSEVFSLRYKKSL